MAESTTPPTIDPVRWRRDVLIGAGIMLGVLVLGYFLLGREYYRSKFEDDLLIGGDDDLVSEAAWNATKATFLYAYLTFALVGTAAITAALLWPREVGHALAASFGLLYVGSGIVILTRGQMPPLIGVFQAVMGGVLLRLGWSSWKRKDRAAWAFLLSLSGVLAGAMLFGAPRIKAAMHAPGLWYVLIVPFVLVAQAIALYRSRNEYV